MKKEWREFHSENGEIWELLVDHSEPYLEKDMISKTGNHAVLKRNMISADYIITSIIPAARIVDDVTQKIGREKLFYLKIDLMNGEDWFCMSNVSFEKEEIVKLANFFIGLNKTQAERVWKAKKLGEISTFRLDK
jgi:hypothetical protein